jgi:hypothetical protein
VGVGLPAAPALVQAVVRRGDGQPVMGGFMAGPQGDDEDRMRQLAEWHNRLNIRFELGTLYTMIAGLLNILAIWDAYGGPVVTEPGKKEKEKERERGPPKEANDQ